MKQPDSFSHAMVAAEQHTQTSLQLNLMPVDLMQQAASRHFLHHWHDICTVMQHGHELTCGSLWSWTQSPACHQHMGPGVSGP